VRRASIQVLHAHLADGLREGVWKHVQNCNGCVSFSLGAEKSDLFYRTEYPVATCSEAVDGLFRRGIAVAKESPVRL